MLGFLLGCGWNQCLLLTPTTEKNMFLFRLRNLARISCFYWNQVIFVVVHLSSSEDQIPQFYSSFPHLSMLDYSSSLSTVGTDISSIRYWMSSISNCLQQAHLDCRRGLGMPEKRYLLDRVKWYNYFYFDCTTKWRRRSVGGTSKTVMWIADWSP